MLLRADACGWAVSLSLISVTASAQTIADYSHVQRNAIEDAIAQANARLAVQASPAPTPASAAGMAAPLHRPADAMEPALRVSGTFSSASEALVEIAVDGVPYLLSAGQSVPGTRWRVETVAVDRIVLGRGSSASEAALRKSFALQALR